MFAALSAGWSVFVVLSAAPELLHPSPARNGVSEQSNTFGFARSPTTQSDGGHVSAAVEIDVRVELDRGAGARSDKGRIQGAGPKKSRAVSNEPR